MTPTSYVRSARIVEKAITCGANVNNKNMQLVTPLAQWARDKCDHTAGGILMLLRHGADPSSLECIAAMLLRAANSCSLTRVVACADIADQNGNTLLHHVAQNSHEQILAQAVRPYGLFHGSFDFFARNKDGDTFVEISQKVYALNQFNDKAKAVKLICESILRTWTKKWRAQLINVIAAPDVTGLIPDVAGIVMAYIDGLGFPFQTNDTSNDDVDADQPMVVDEAPATRHPQAPTVGGA